MVTKSSGPGTRTAPPGGPDERASAADELRRQQILLQYIINFVPHAIFWKDREARLLGGNQSFLTKALGVSSVDEMRGKTDYDFFPREQADYFRRCDFAVMESGEPMLDIEEPQSQCEKGRRILLTSKVPLRDESGAIIGLLGSFADITERKRMEEELEEARKAAEAAAQAKSEFLTVISHEIRTPLALILGPLATLLARGEEAVSPRARASLLCVQRNARRLHRLVDDVLDYQKIEAGKLRLDWESVDVAELCADAVDDARPAADQRGLELSLIVDPALRTVPLDRRKFEKIVLNLLGNALKFTPPPGRVVLSLSAAPDCFELAVEDTGPGIPADKRHLLFQRFQQLDGATTRKHEGTGIGLSLVKDLVEMMGGAVGVTSEPGAGSRFFVRIPRAADRLVAAAPAVSDAPWDAPRSPAREGYFQDTVAPADGAARAACARGARGARVLVAEDNPDMRAYLLDLLRGDYEVELATNGREALSAAEERRPDVIVSDVMMPEMDGGELVARLKQDPELSSIPVILLTARASRAETVGGLDSGADDYLATTWPSPSTPRSSGRGSARRCASTAPTWRSPPRTASSGRPCGGCRRRRRSWSRPARWRRWGR
jgi:PAS domain S-box-containing protein